MKDKTKNWLEKVKQTKEKRKSQVCKVHELKFDKSHLSKEKLMYLNKLFLEAKWLYNFILATDNIFEYGLQISKELRNLMPVENKTSVFSKSNIENISYDSMKQETTESLAQW